MPALAPPPAPPATPKPSSVGTPAKTGADSSPAPVPTEKSPESYMGDIGDEFNELDHAQDDPKPEQRKRGEDGKFTKPEKQAEVEVKVEPDKPKTEDAPPPEEKKLGPFATVRKAKEALEKERDEVFRPKIQQLESKVQEYERTLTELKTKQPDVKPFEEKLTAIQKENATLREEIRRANYLKSPEYLDTIKKPMDEAWGEALEDMKGFDVTMPDGTTRPVNAGDLSTLSGLTGKQRGDLAREWFGDSALLMLQHVKTLTDLSRKHDKALEEANKNAAQHDTQQSTEAQKANSAFQQAYSAAHAELTTRFPKIFAPDESDPQGNEILKKGLEYADTVFSANGNLTPQQKAGRLAVIRAKAANHDRLFSRLKAESKLRAELEEKLAEYEESAPPTTDASEPGSVKTIDFMGEVEAELRKLDKPR